MDGKHQVVWKKYCSFGIVCDCGTVSAPWSIDMAFRHGPSGVVWFWLEPAFVMSFFYVVVLRGFTFSFAASLHLTQHV